MIEALGRLWRAVAYAGRRRGATSAVRKNLSGWFVRTSGDVDGELVHLGGGVTGALVHAHHALLRGRGGQAEHLAGLGVEPRALEVGALDALDREVTFVRLTQLLLGDSHETAVHVHELGHRR